MKESYNEKMSRFSEAGLYFVTSQDLSNGRSTLDIVRAALDGGVKLIQLREKDMRTKDLVELAIAVRKLTTKKNSLLIINDRPDIAMIAGADGVHLGQDDVPVKDVRKEFPELIVGASTHSVEEAVKSQKDGASYINIGPLFATGTKRWAGEFIGMKGLKEISSVVSVPYTVMGGIKMEHIPDLIDMGVKIIAVVTAITKAVDPKFATYDMLKHIITREKESFL